MAEVVATFGGALNSIVAQGVPTATLKIDNTSGADVLRFGISGKTCKFSIIWDAFGGFGAIGGVLLDPAFGVNGITGENTEVVMAGFIAFNNGDSVTFSDLDADLEGDSNSTVRVLDLLGARAVAVLGDGTSAFGEFTVTNSSTLRAVLIRP
jgi:hypothetical protein